MIPGDFVKGVIGQMTGMISMVTPLLLHMVILEACAVLLQGKADTTFCTAIASAAVIPIALHLYKKERKQQSATSHKLLFGMGCLLAGGCMNLLLSTLMNLMQLTRYFSNQTQETLLLAEIPVKVIGLVILVPIAEELIFRGLIYRRMQHFFSWKLSAFFSAALFAVYHGNPIQIIFAFPMALALTGVYEYGNNLIFPILFHAGSNLAAVLLSL